MEQGTMRLVVAAVLALATTNTSAQQLCYAIADGSDQLVSILGDGTDFDDIGDLDNSNDPVDGADTVEGMTIQPGTGTIFAAAAAGDLPSGLGFTTGVLGTINASTALFTPIGEHGSCSTDGTNSISVDDIDGVTFNPFTGELWALNRREAATTDDPNPPDLLVQLNPTTGAVVPDVFGAGLSCVQIVGSALDMDDISFNPTNGQMYGIASTSGDDTLVTINLATGVATEIGGTGSAGVNDIEGLSFTPDGTLFATTGTSAADDEDDDALWTINVTTGVATKIIQFSDAGASGISDFESVGCMLDPDGTPLVSSIGDRVWVDSNQNGVQNGAESGLAGVTVELFLNAGTVPVSTTVTNGSGNYDFAGLPPGDYQIGFVLPAQYVFTTPNQGNDAQDSDADVGTGRTVTITLLADSNDDTVDAGMVLSANIQVAKALQTTGTIVSGQRVSYQIVVSNTGPASATNVLVADVPTNLTGLTVTGSTPAGACTTLPCTIANLAVGASETLTVEATVQ